MNEWIVACCFYALMFVISQSQSLCFAFLFFHTSKPPKLSSQLNYQRFNVLTHYVFFFFDYSLFVVASLSVFSADFSYTMLPVIDSLSRFILFFKSHYIDKWQWLIEPNPSTKFIYHVLELTICNQNLFKCQS